ncbi:MAG: response regulator [Pontiellaceae bacterium]|nr:response regulator [Pontiellaceae bacterium]MBN2784918.1 response regulator [Pontiellaceae bacterium]
MNSRKKPTFPVARLAITLTVLTATIVAVSWALYTTQYVKSYRETLLAQEAYSQNLKAEYVRSQIRRLLTDVHVISGEDRLITILEGSGTSIEFADHLKRFSRYRGIYDQIRALDLEGNEVIRINLEGRAPVLVPTEDLQNKAHRYYYKDIIWMNRDQVYMSRFDLNVEYYETEKPSKPTIRFGTPIFSREGSKIGVLVLNYLGDDLLKELLNLSFNSPGELMLLDQDGFWLLNENHKDMEWGFMIPDRAHCTMAEQNPKAWQEIKDSLSGQFILNDGLYTFTKIYPKTLGVVCGNPSELASDTVSEPEWIILSFVPRNKLHTGGTGTMVMFGLTDALLLVLLGSISVKLLIATNRRRAAELELRRLNQALEKKVGNRTQSLSKANAALRNEVQHHQQSLMEKNEIEAQLRQAQKMEAIGTLAGGVAHDFNNILTPILGNAEMAAIQMDKNHPLQLEMSEIITAAKRAKELIQQILMFSRKNEQEMLPLRMELVVKEAVRLLRHAIPATIDIQTDIEPNCGEVRASPTQIHQIVMNLCTNAYQAMDEEGGSLTISMRREQIDPDNYRCQINMTAGAYIRLEISDTGPGIPEDAKERIFEPYYTTKEVGKGTGLGLSVVHTTVQDLKGHIEFSSVAGQGTTFTIFLPVNAKGSTREGIDARAIPPGSEHILIVDDQESVVQMQVRMLGNLGYKTTAFINPHEGLEYIRNNARKVDLLITDMAMPKMTGLKLIEQIRQYAPDMKIIICSGFMEEMNRETAQAFGIHGYLRKPVSIKDLSNLVRDILDGKG